jgi:Tol biopolymer transport system component
LLQAAPAVAARPEPVSGTRFLDTGFEPSISGDGRFVAFSGGPASVFQNGAQIYLRDRRRGRTELVSRSVTSGQPDAQSLNPSISSNGRYVAFRSDAARLVTGDNNDVSDVFVRDRTAGTTTRVSVGPGGAEADGASVSPTISANGRVVAFVSRARNLGGPDTGDTRDVFVRDLDAGTTTRVSTGLGGAEPNGESYTAAISGDGRTVVFASAASNLVSDDTGGFVDVFAFDRASGSIRRVNLTAAGDQATGDTLFGQGGPVTDASGDVFAFGTFASNLLGGPSEADVVARDSSTVQRLSTGAMLDNLYQEGESAGPSMNGDGRLVAFAGTSSQLPRYLDASAMDVYVRNRISGALTRVSQLSQCRAVGEVNGFPAISADGRWVAFQSNAIDLLQPGVYRGGVGPPVHAYVASTRPPSGTEVCALSVRPRTIHPALGGTITYTLSQRGSFRIRIFQKRGRKLVRRAAIRGSGISAGPHSLAFNGRFHGKGLGRGTFVAVANGSARGASWRRATFKIRLP